MQYWCMLSMNVLGNQWGMSLACKLPKSLRLSRTKKQLTNMAVSSIRYQYIVPIACFKNFASVTIAKKGKWMKNRDWFKYNEDM